ncbi:MULTISPECIES: DUF485 domain-containing protein [Actinosynnema]|uniref:DUF485 domain-containing protein n=1 Tax=Actinosynnema TaxID=40566 RepID=UPI0020A6173A|nr:DUF485 domain-containing protein [Actinosynnema pretiosum]MCP2099201.1 Uncharacterized membrane protein, DUF485 family [Actinosynnema pretiosum]
MTKAFPPPVESRHQRADARGFATFDDPAPALLVDEDGNPDYVAIQQSEDFRELRRRTALFVVPAILGFLAWYLAYVGLSAFAPDFMATRVFGVVNVGLLLGLLQFVTTIALTLGYSRYARLRLDPRVAAVRELTDEDGN